ncbi:MAG: metallophosphoesterase family protein [Nocardioides sp.]
MRIAVISDVHGNAAALEAALADAGTVDAHWFLGDLVAHGPRPVECVRRVAGLPGLVAVRGNTDRYVLTSPPDPVMVPSFDWTRSRLSADDLAWLGSLPIEAVPVDGVLLVHASPGRDDGPGLDPHTPDTDLDRAFTASDAALVLVGHTHHPDDRVLGDVRVVNPGSISLPRTSDAIARYAMLTDAEGEWTVEHRAAAYDRDSVLADLRSGDHPSADWLVEKLTTPWG